MPQSSYPKVFENNLTDARLKDTGDISPTVLARYGTGGNTQPIVLETFTQQRFDYYIANNVGKTLGVKTGGIGGGSETLIVDAYPESSFGTYSESGVCGSLRRTGGETGGVARRLSLANGKNVTDTLTVSSCKKGFSGNQEIRSGGYHVVLQKENPPARD